MRAFPQYDRPAPLRAYPYLQLSQDYPNLSQARNMLEKLFSNQGLEFAGGRLHRRSDPRVRLRIPARLILLTGIQSCILEDLSVAGAALIPQDALPPIGTSGILQCQKVEAFGEVVWSRSGRCAVKFDERLPLAQVVALRHFADSFEETERAEFRERARIWVQGGNRDT